MVAVNAWELTTKLNEVEIVLNSNKNHGIKSRKAKQQLTIHKNGTLISIMLEAAPRETNEFTCLGVISMLNHVTKNR